LANVIIMMIEKEIKFTMPPSPYMHSRLPSCVWTQHTGHMFLAFLM